MNLELLKAIFQYRRKTIITVFALIALNGLILGMNRFFYAPALDKIRQEWTARRLESLHNSSAANGVLSRNGAADLASFRKKIPAKNELPEILGELFQAVSDASLKSGAVSYKPEFIKEQRLWAYSVKMSVTGRYGKLKEFIDDLQNSERMLVVDEISFSRVSEDEEGVSLAVGLTFYLLGEAQ